MNPKFRNLLIQQYGPKGAAIVERNVRAALTYEALVSAGGDLQVQQGKEWLNTLLNVGPHDHSAFLGAVDWSSCGPTGERVDWVELGVGDIRPHTEGVSGSHYAGWSPGKRIIVPKDCEVKIRPTYELVNKKIRRGTEELRSMFRTKFLNEILRLFIKGDESSADPSLVAFDGWLKKSLSYTNTNKYASAWTATPDYPAIMYRQIEDMAEVEEGMYLEMPGMGYIMSRKSLVLLKKAMQDKNCDAAYKLYWEDPLKGVRSFSDYPIYTPSWWPNDLIMMADPKILWGRFSDEVNGAMPLIEYDRLIEEKRHLFVLSLPIRAELAWDPAIHVAYDTANTTYVAWAA